MAKTRRRDCEKYGAPVFWRRVELRDILWKTCVACFTKRFAGEPHVGVLFGHKTVAVGQNHQSAWVEIEGGKHVEADFVNGCDGASNVVRKALFGGAFPGSMWDIYRETYRWDGYLLHDTNGLTNIGLVRPRKFVRK